MKRSIYFLFVFLLATSCSTMKHTPKEAERQTEGFRYELECAGNGSQGTYLVKVWSYSKRKNVATEQCKRNAVHGIIFKGYTGKNGCVGQRPLARTPGTEMEHKEYFERFFAPGGEWMKYVTLTEGTIETIKVGREYKTGVVVSVNKDDLRKALESAGIIRSLSAGF